MQAAAESGAHLPCDCFALSPRELHLLLTAHRARLDQRAAGRLLLARYIALAVHDPLRLPDLPPPSSPSRPMTDEEMKQRLLAWRGKENHDP